MNSSNQSNTSGNHSGSSALLLADLIRIRNELQARSALGTYSVVFDRVIQKLNKLVMKEQLQLSSALKPEGRPGRTKG